MVNKIFKARRIASFCFMFFIFLAYVGAQEKALYTTTYSYIDPVIRQRINYDFSIFTDKIVVSCKNNTYQNRIEYTVQLDDLYGAIGLFCALGTVK
jgi:hypothetical protein